MPRENSKTPLERAHETALTVQDLAAPFDRAEDDESLDLIQQESLAHQAPFIDSLEREHPRIFEVPSERPPAKLAARSLATICGSNVTLPPALISVSFCGRANFVRRVGELSDQGGWLDELAETKLVSTPKAKSLPQLSLDPNPKCDTPEQIKLVNNSSKVHNCAEARTQGHPTIPHHCRSSSQRRLNSLGDVGK